MRLNGLTVIGCDGTNVNTGHTGGIIRLMTITMVNLFASNKRVTPPSSTKFFGWATAGSKEFCRALRKAIKTYEELPVAPFSSFSPFFSFFLSKCGEYAT
ncbi:hypothetical protein AVEN_117560-1 [Araneus ventricosus]|uniref:Uncharacterized protein n=1 Tax=Araneus ventricosus TaxID=182803 RepID=A0A4Y2TFU1_ARAVE|nr:hypothetical protein AVEN_117560-1 [Araneus ventricosus]